MLGKFVPYGNTPFFWTRHYNKSLQYVGNGAGANEIFVDGDVKGQKFLAFYLKDNKVLAVSGMGRSGDMLTMFQAFNANKVPSADQIKKGSFLENLKKELKASGVAGCNREGCC